MDLNLPFKGFLGVEMECCFGDVFGAVIQANAKHELITMKRTNSPNKRTFTWRRSSSAYNSKVVKISK